MSPAWESPEETRWWESGKTLPALGSPSGQLPTGGIGSRGRTRGTIVFVRNKETGLIEQAVVKLAQATISHEQAEEIRDRVAGMLRDQPVVIVGMEWNVEVV